MRDISPFKYSYNNGGDELFLVSMPGISLSRADTYITGDLGYVTPEIKSETSVELVSARSGKTVTISGEVDLVLNILEKLK